MKECVLLSQNHHWDAKLFFKFYRILHLRLWKKLHTPICLWVHKIFKMHFCEIQHASSLSADTTGVVVKKTLLLREKSATENDNAVVSCVNRERPHLCSDVCGIETLLCINWRAPHWNSHAVFRLSSVRSEYGKRDKRFLMASIVPVNLFNSVTLSFLPRV